jgi:hypothetical protein
VKIKLKVIPRKTDKPNPSTAAVLLKARTPKEKRVVKQGFCTKFRIF